jgi:predicted AAA+ superfamily ATPase
MEISDIRDYLAEFEHWEPPELVRRGLQAPPSKDHIISIIGPRRAGKTFYLFQEIGELGKEGSLYLNFDDTRLFGIKGKELRDIIRVYIEAFKRPPSSIFLDEVQNVDGWERAVREIFDLRRYCIFVTGSSSKLLSKEIATHLRGRTLSYLLLPFSFGEFLKAKGMGVEGDISKDEASSLRGLLIEYLRYGGFPQIAFLERGSDKERMLKELLDLTLFKDIVERHEVRSLHLISSLFKQLVSNFSSEFSVNGLYNYLKSQGVKVAKDTLYKYLNFFIDSVSLFFIDRYSRKIRVKESWPKKVYLCDTGLALMAGLPDQMGRLMENAAFLHLLRESQRRPLMGINYHKDINGEVDFVVSEGPKVERLIQVTYASSRSDIGGRELRALAKASEQLGCENLLAITWDFEDSIEIGGKAIGCVPLWKWLLGLP